MTDEMSSVKKNIGYTYKVSFIYYVIVMKNIDTQRKTLLTYTKWMILPPDDLLQLSGKEKLIMCQITDQSVIKKWPIWNYVPIWYIERCLNFVSNFERGLKVQREWVNTYTNKNWKEIHDAWVLADFYIVIDWKRIERSCYGTRQMYWNPAISNFAVLESARSIATKSFADTLWIASDKLSKEFDELRKQRESDNITMDDATSGFTSPSQ